jgi:hypothetical protein
MRLRKTNFFFGLSLWLLLAAGFGYAQTPRPPSEYQLKAAFLYNFAKFIDWPPETFPDDKSPFIIGILGDNPFGTDLERTVADKKINDRPIAIRPFRTAAEATNCQILFISSSEKKRFSEIIQSLHGSAVLTVGEAGQFIESGGMVNFVQEASKIRFQINDDAAKAARLKISSKLLSLAVQSPR